MYFQEKVSTHVQVDFQGFYAFTKSGEFLNVNTYAQKFVVYVPKGYHYVNFKYENYLECKFVG
jgi:hypothetical protein